MTTGEPIEWRFKLIYAVSIMCTFSLVDFGSSEKFDINKFYLFLQNVRTTMNDISWMIVDMFHYLTLLRT